MKLPRFKAEIQNTGRQHNIAKADVIRRKSPRNAYYKQQRWLQVVNEVTRGLLGFPVTLFHLSKNG
jgi:hypothetical protein